MSSLARHAFSPVALLLCVMLLSGRPQAFQGALAQKRLLTPASCPSRPSPFTPLLIADINIGNPNIAPLTSA